MQRKRNGPFLEEKKTRTVYIAQVKSMGDNCGEWVECMGVASGCSEQEVGVASGSG